MGFDAGYGIGSVKPGVCTSSTRPASPFDGQVIYETDTNVVSVYDGAAWATVGPAAASALTLITAQPFTTQPTVSMAAGIFSAAYKNYLVELEISTTSGNQNLNVRFNAAGTPVTSANYHGGMVFAQTNDTVNGFGSAAATALNIGQVVSGRSGAWTFTVIAPQAATASNMIVGGIGASSQTAVTAGIAGGGALLVSAAHDGLTWFVGGTISGTYRVYGLADS